MPDVTSIASELEAEEDEHTIENTKSVIENIRELIKGDEEGELDLYTKLNVAKPGEAMSPISVQLEDAGTSLSYTLTITPLDD